MGGDISWVLLGAAGGAALVLLLVGLFALLRRRPGARTDLQSMLTAAQLEADDLRLRLDVANARLDGHTGARRRPSDDDAGYVITEVGTAAVLFGDRLPAEVAEAPIEVPDRLVLSATLGGPLVKAAALAHGVRRALSAESRNRIRFEMRREVRAARKRRRRLVREHLQHVRAAERAGEGIG
jgi:hypothetical protein